MLPKNLPARICQRPLVTVTIVLVLVLLTSAVVLAQEYLPTTEGTDINGALFFQFDPADPTGTGLFNPFLRISGNSAVVQGYNTDYRPLQFNEDSPWTDSIPLSEVPMVVYQGTKYREFQLDINQTNSNPLESLDEVQIWLGGSDAATIRGFVPEARPPSTAYGTFPGYTPQLVYNMDADEDNWVVMDYGLNAGSGKRDLKLLVPNAKFGNYGAACEYMGTGCDKYVVFYTQFGAHNANNDGFEEWGVAIYNTVSGYKWHDVNGNGVLDTGEPKLANWTICAQAIVQGAPSGEPICTKTAGDGSYVLPLPGGTYKIYETCTPGWDQTFPAPTGGVCGSGVHNVTVSGGDAVCDKNFGNRVPPVNVKACKFEDKDANPATTADRVAVPGWTVKLTKNGEVIDTQTTGADGCYTWTNLPALTAPDHYDVHEVVPDDWYAWTPTDINCGEIAPGGTFTANFVNSKKPSVKACKFEDKDTNPATTADRVAVPGWTVKLTKNGEVIDTQTTGADGCYTWTNLVPLTAPNYYDAHEVVPDGWYAWGPTSVTCDPIASGGTCTANFVNSKKVNVKACKFEDKDANPATTADRVAVPGWTVKLTKNGEVIDTQTTGADGCYTWALRDPLAPPNAYDAHEVVPTDWYAWTPVDVTCDPIASGGTCTANFVNSKRVKVTACKKQDMDGSLATTNDQTPLPGWTVYYSIDGVKQVPGKATGANGCASWEGLVPGKTYDVEEDVLPGWIALTATHHTFPGSVSGDVQSFTFINFKPKGCTYTQGYWKTHSKYGPAGPYDETWDLKAGGDAKFLSNAWPTGYTWYSIMWAPPAKGNAYLILAHQYVAAWLNIHNVDPEKTADASVLGTALTEAEHLLATYTPTYDFKNDPQGVRDEFIRLAGILGEFNEGMMGVPHCGD